jgi:hypothetical protein
MDVFLVLNITLFLFYFFSFWWPAYRRWELFHFCSSSRTFSWIEILSLTFICSRLLALSCQTPADKPSDRRIRSISVFSHRYHYNTYHLSLQPLWTFYKNYNKHFSKICSNLTLSRYRPRILSLIFIWSRRNSPVLQTNDVSVSLLHFNTLPSKRFEHFYIWQDLHYWC